MLAQVKNTILFHSPSIIPSIGIVIFICQGLWLYMTNQCCNPCGVWTNINLINNVLKEKYHAMSILQWLDLFELEFSLHNTTHNIWVMEQGNMNDALLIVCSLPCLIIGGLVCTYSSSWLLVSSRTEYLETFRIYISVSNV